MTTIAVAAPAPAHRMSPLRTIRHALSLAGRHLIKMRKNPEQFADVTIQPILFLVLFVFLFGGAISGNWHAYLQTLVPGMMVQNTLFASMGTGYGLGTDIQKGVFDRFRSLPIGRSAPLIGAVLGDVVRSLVAMVVLLGFAAVLGFRVHTGPVGLVLGVGLMVLAGLALCWIGVFVAMLVRTPQAAQGIMIAIMFPLSFGSNVFVPARTMPGWLQAWVSISPVTKLVDANRGLLLGGPVAGPILTALAALVAVVVVFFPLANWAYRRRVA